MNNILPIYPVIIDLLKDKITNARSLKANMNAQIAILADLLINDNSELHKIGNLSDSIAIDKTIYRDLNKQIDTAFLILKLAGYNLHAVGKEMGLSVD
jgi:hypothetical protein